MLNIQTRISLTKASKRKIKKYWKRVEGNLDSKSWGSIAAEVKNELSGRLYDNQGYVCAYCERYLLGLGPEMDHFAGKADYPRFTFNPINIFYACSFCNSTDRKGDVDTILLYNDRYTLCDFAILHPYIDDIDAELIYADADRINFDWNACTQRARDTIVKLQYDDVFMTQIRARDLTHQRLNPLATDDEKELIQLSISYSKYK